MATASDGRNPARTGVPARQDPSPKRAGRASSLDPTNQEGQTPDSIFGMPTGIKSTGAGGSDHGGSTAPADVTLHPGQLEDELGHSSAGFITDSGMPGSEGAKHPMGGESVTYTDPWSNIGGVDRDNTVQGNISGPGDWTTWGADNGFSGPTLPGLENNRPTDSGMGSGHVKGAGHPNSGA